MKKNWETLFNSESEDATWEIIHDYKKHNVRLLFFGDPNGSGSTTDTHLTYKQFRDLVKFMKKLDRTVSDKIVQSNV